MQLFDLGEEREKCNLSKVRESERDMAKWRQEVELEREELMKEQNVKMERRGSLFQERARTTESDDLEPGNTERKRKIRERKQ